MRVVELTSMKDYKNKSKTYSATLCTLYKRLKV